MNQKGSTEKIVIAVVVGFAILYLVFTFIQKTM